MFSLTKVRLRSMAGVFSKELLKVIMQSIDAAGSVSAHDNATRHHCVITGVKFD